MANTYSTEAPELPRSLVVSSLASATAEVEAWQRENLYDHLVDGDGLSWTLRIATRNVADPETSQGMLWEVLLSLQADVTAEQLLATQALDRQKDARLVALLGATRVPLRMRPERHVAMSEEAAKRFLAERLPQLKASFARASLVEVKRALVGRWVDESRLFGGLQV